jgi:hypothetical protein
MSSYEFAQIRIDTFQEDPLQLGRISLDFPDGQKWAIKSLVFAVTIQPPTGENGNLESLKAGATVAVFRPLPSQPILGHLDPK